MCRRGHLPPSSSPPPPHRGRRLALSHGPARRRPVPTYEYMGPWPRGTGAAGSAVSLLYLGRHRPAIFRAPPISLLYLLRAPQQTGCTECVLPQSACCNEGLLGLLYSGRTQPTGCIEGTQPQPSGRTAQRTVYRRRRPSVACRWVRRAVVTSRAAARTELRRTPKQARARTQLAASQGHAARCSPQGKYLHWRHAQALLCRAKTPPETRFGRAVGGDVTLQYCHSANHGARALHFR